MAEKKKTASPANIAGKITVPIKAEKKPEVSASVADHLREAIKAEMAKGRSLNEIAKLADVSYNSVHRFVNVPGKTLYIESVEALAVAVGLKVSIHR